MIYLPFPLTPALAHTLGMSDTVGDTAKPASKGITGKGWVLILAPALLIMGGLGVWAAVGGGDGNPEGEAVTACQDAVKARLKAPGSASFHSGATETKPSIWRVVGDVDAANSFGGEVRTSFTCTVVWHEDKTAEVVGVTVQ